jgi:hypothetical protein
VTGGVGDNVEDNLLTYDESDAIGADNGELLSRFLVVQQLLLTRKKEEHLQRQHLPYLLYCSPEGLRCHHR